MSVFAEPTAATRAEGKKGGEWVYVSHDLADADELLTALKSRLHTGEPMWGATLLKLRAGATPCEPMWGANLMRRRAGATPFEPMWGANR